MRQQAEFGNIVDVLGLDGEVVDAVGAGEGAAGDDHLWAGAAADHLVVVDFLSEKGDILLY